MNDLIVRNQSIDHAIAEVNQINTEVIEKLTILEMIYKQLIRKLPNKKYLAIFMTGISLGGIQLGIAALFGAISFPLIVIFLGGGIISAYIGAGGGAGSSAGGAKVL